MFKIPTSKWLKRISSRLVLGILLTSFLSISPSPTYAWRLFGWEIDGWIGDGAYPTPDGSACYAPYARTYYFLGIPVNSDVQWQKIECSL